MATTQKVYIGDNLIKKNYRGVNEVVSKWGNEFDQYDIDYLIVAGGGSSGGDNAGGGGAGGYLSATSYTLDWGTEYTTNVGAGGVGTNGNNSTFLGFTSIGGGAGGGNTQTGSDGGSGGGGAYFEFSYPGGSGSLGQGFNGGTGYGSTPLEPGGQNTDGAGGGGGGASEVGADGSEPLGIPTGGNGGDGLQWLDGNYYAGGGGGGVPGGGTTSTGGLGGGGNGGDKSDNPAGEPGEPNTGGGGGVGFQPKSGGSGIIIIRYQSEWPLSQSGDRMYPSGGYWYHEFLQTGTSSFKFE